MDKQLLLFGLMRKAGRIAVGDEPVTDALRRGEVYAVCVAADAAENTAERFERHAREEEIPFLRLSFDKSTFGGVFGRRDVAVAGVTDLGFAARLLELDETMSGTEAAREYREQADRAVEEQKKKRRKTPAWQSKAPAAQKPGAEAEEKPAEGKKSAPVAGKPVPKSRKTQFSGEMPFSGETQFSGKAGLPEAGEKKPFENREGKIYGRAPRAQHASLGDRRREDAVRKLERDAERGIEPPRRYDRHGRLIPAPQSTAASEKKPYNSRSYTNKKPYGNNSYGQKSYGNSSYGEKKSYGQKSYGNSSYGGKKSYGGQKSYGNSSYGEKKPYGNKSYGEKSGKRGNGGKA